MHCPLTKQCTAVDKSLQHQEILKLKKSWKSRELTPGQLGVKYERYLCAMPIPQLAQNFLGVNRVRQREARA